MSSASEELDNPLYGDFEDYLDGKLPPARHREVADLLARSAAAREMLEELRTARKWLEGTHWDVPEPSGWPSAGEILARAGWRPAASLPAAKPDRSTGRFAGWLSGWMPWQWNVRSPVWVFGAAASVLLLVGGGLWWWVLSPSAPDELAQSKASETSAPPTSELPAQPGAATARPEDAARPVLPAEAAPVGAAPQKKTRRHRCWKRRRRRGNQSVRGPQPVRPGRRKTGNGRELYARRRCRQHRRNRWLDSHPWRLRHQPEMKRRTRQKRCRRNGGKPVRWPQLRCRRRVLRRLWPGGRPVLEPPTGPAMKRRKPQGQSRARPPMLREQPPQSRR